MISKVVGDFVYDWVLEEVKLKLQWNQYGALKGSTTVYALVYLLHNMFTATVCLHGNVCVNPFCRLSENI